MKTLRRPGQFWVKLVVLVVIFFEYGFLGQSDVNADGVVNTGPVRIRLKTERMPDLNHYEYHQLEKQCLAGELDQTTLSVINRSLMDPVGSYDELGLKFDIRYEYYGFKVKRSPSRHSSSFFSEFMACDLVLTPVGVSAIK
jgi:hypothetical protein